MAGLVKYFPYGYPADRVTIKFTFEVVEVATEKFPYSRRYQKNSYFPLLHNPGKPEFAMKRRDIRINQRQCNTGDTVKKSIG